MIINTMRLGSDTFAFRKQAMIEDEKGLDATSKTNVEGFNVYGVHPSDCNRRAIFKIEDTYYKLDIDADMKATLNSNINQTPAIDNILAEGNTAEELASITVLPDDFLNKISYPVLVTDAPPEAVVMPTFGLELKVRNNQDQFEHTEMSAEQSIANSDVSIVSVVPKPVTTGKATVNVTVSIKQGDTWTGWLDTKDVAGKKASAIKYKADYVVTTLDGTDSASVSVLANFADGSSIVLGNKAEIVTITQNYDNPLVFAECMVVHKKLMDSEIKCFVAFRNKPTKREMINIGIGTGETQTLVLGVPDKDGNIVPDENIDHNTLQIYFDGKAIYNNSFNTKTSETTVTADKTVNISASYEYGSCAEEWREMDLKIVQPYNSTGEYMNKFEYTLPTNETDKTVATFKAQLYRPSGSVTEYNATVLGIATGNKQLFVLPHFAKKETINCAGSWTYDDDNRILTVVADKGTEIKPTYDWIAESSEIHDIFAGLAQ